MGKSIAPTRALFVEDMARNLKPAKAIGMTTVWVNNGSEQADREFHLAIAQGQLTIRINETPQVSQPSPFSGSVAAGGVGPGARSCT